MKKAETALTRLSAKLSEYYPDDRAVKEDIRVIKSEVLKLRREEKRAAIFEEVINEMADKLVELGYVPDQNGLKVNIIDKFFTGK
jgi:hypothetical protein